MSIYNKEIILIYICMSIYNKEKKKKFKNLST